jgi:hypothetical protein
MYFMDAGRYRLHRRALQVLDTLAPKEQEQVRAKVAALAKLPPERWVGRGAKRLDLDPTLYLVRINASLRAILRANDDGVPEIQDLVRRDTLATFANGHA